MGPWTYLTYVGKFKFLELTEFPACYEQLMPLDMPRYPFTQRDCNFFFK